MNPQKALQICMKAHAGQYRRPYTLNGDKHIEYGEEVKNLPYHETNWHTLSDGCQIRLNGSQSYREPYYTHPIAVADMMITDDEKTLAYLHDVVEDTDWQLRIVGTIVDQDVRFEIFCGNERYELTGTQYYDLLAITKVKGVHYQIYLGDVADRPNTRKCKIADMVHNMSSNPSDKQKEKYLNGMAYLLSTL